MRAMTRVIAATDKAQRLALGRPYFSQGGVLKTLIAVVLLACSFNLHVAAQDHHYQVTKKIPIPGQGGWDYLTVDEGARRLYVSHGTQVEVIDVDAGTHVGKIENTPGVHGIAVAPELERGFISNGQAATVTIFDLKTMKRVADVPTGKKPDAIIHDPATSRVFAFNGGSNSATVINAKDGLVAGTVDLGGGPEFAASDGKGYVYNNLETKAWCSRSTPRSSPSSRSGKPVTPPAAWLSRTGACSSAAAAR
jgi:hypothetical protein